MVIMRNERNCEDSLTTEAKQHYPPNVLPPPNWNEYISMINLGLPARGLTYFVPKFHST